MCVKVIASQRCDVFLRHGVECWQNYRKLLSCKLSVSSAFYFFSDLLSPSCCFYCLNECFSSFRFFLWRLLLYSFFWQLPLHRTLPVDLKRHARAIRFVRSTVWSCERALRRDHSDCCCCCCCWIWMASFRRLVYLRCPATINSTRCCTFAERNRCCVVGGLALMLGLGLEPKGSPVVPRRKLWTSEVVQMEQSS